MATEETKYMNNVLLIIINFIIVLSLIRSIPILKEILDGIKIYFDFMLKDQLLYNEEMQQYDNVITKKSHMTTANCINSDEADSVNSDDVIIPSSVYGAYHLLRLFGIVHYNCRDAAYKIYCIYSMYNLHVIVVFFIF